MNKKCLGFVIIICFLFLNKECGATTEKFYTGGLQGMGINIHTHASFPQTLEPIQVVGFKVIRTNLYWSHIETSKGEYDWSNYDKLIKKMDEAGIRPLLSLSFSNLLYEPSVRVRSSSVGDTRTRIAAPASEVSIKAFADFAAAAAKRYKKSNVIWEIWNEPNYYYFWAPEPNPSLYASLASRACEAIKLADPNATVVGPSSAGTPFDDDYIEWWRPFLKNSSLECIDAISVHPYVWNTNKGPEINFKKYQHLRDLLAEYTQRDIPIISSEFGFSTSDWNISEERQAALFIRNYMVNLLADVQISVWYDWRNDGEDPKNREHNFGIITHKRSKKPLYYAVKTLAELLDGYQLGGRFNVNGNLVPLNDHYKEMLVSERGPFVLLFRHAEKGPLIVAWTTFPNEIEYKIPTELFKTSKIKAVNYLGGNAEHKVQGDSIFIKLTEFPIYFFAEGQK